MIFGKGGFITELRKRQNYPGGRFICLIKAKSVIRRGHFVIDWIGECKIASSKNISYVWELTIPNNC